MSTSLASHEAKPLERRSVPALAAPGILELRGPGAARPRRVEVQARRTPTGVELDCFVQPAPGGLEIEVSAGETRLVRSVPAGGRLTIEGLASPCRHLSLVLRGGGLPALALLKLPLD